MTPDCDPKDLPKSCPFLPFFRDRYAVADGDEIVVTFVKKVEK